MAVEVFNFLALFLFGAIIGSFLNVVILRYGTGLSIFKGRSRCFSCGKILKWYELVPVFSFLFLRGKCSVCKSKISWQYPLVEFLSGLVFVAIFLNVFHSETSVLRSTISSFRETGFLMVIFSLLIVIAGYDIKHKIIPDPLVYSFGLITLARVFTVFSGSVLFSYPYGVFILASGPILALPFFLLWLFSGGRWIGLGDAKLALGMGWLLMLFPGISAVILAFWIGAVFSLLLMAGEKFPRLVPLRFVNSFFGLKNLSMKSEVPFAPFLILATVLVFFFHWDVIGLADLFQFGYGF